MRQTLLYTTENQVETDLLVDMLWQNGIAALAQPNRAGSGLVAYFGGAAYGDDIFVNEQDYATAKDIVEGYFNNDREDEKNE